MGQMAYSQLAPTLKTGDIVLFSGRYQMSKLVEFLEGSKWSHVGMVVRLDEYDYPLLYEATALTNLPDLLTGKQITGPKLVNLKERLETYGNDVVPYEAPAYAVRIASRGATNEELNRIKEILNELVGLPNPDEKRMIFEVILGRYLFIETKMDDITCSGFIAYTLKQLGWLRGKKPINGFMPKDFSTDGRLALDKAIAYGDEIIINLKQ